MLRDPDVYGHPETFDPERYLTRESDKENLTRFGVQDTDPESMVFGFGRRLVLNSTSIPHLCRAKLYFRRQCPGRYYADTELWLTIACVLATFDILPALDQDGKDIVPVPEFKGALIM